MSDSTLHRLQRLETKMDELMRLVYEMQGELRGWKQIVIFIAGIISLIISLVFNILVGR